MNIFKINGCIWRLQFVPPYSMDLMRSDGTFTIGVTDNNKKTVSICENLSEKMFEKVLCHELVHVFCFENGMGFPCETEELIADFLATYGRDIFFVADEIIGKFAKVA